MCRHVGFSVDHLRVFLLLFGLVCFFRKAYLSFLKNRQELAYPGEGREEKRERVKTRNWAETRKMKKDSCQRERRDCRGYRSAKKEEGTTQVDRKKKEPDKRRCIETERGEGMQAHSFRSDW